ncbi:5'-methylthioadenosine/S-adenosylhomocysteine nucleosidase [Veronia pacifica]|uniref:adenosylhomocysteine nucleosidase n=1 Tax=Veronia pacifica TaxID=1080227 RepID=A0A1C3EAH3_9GAMM|nr:5'-methylthioadenosine/S-adenosylhomocysteine nucleosidase [Veronia pacifica]ODA30228.1 hypothetical protein A8L45_20715 [Veronia pacifica]
MRLGIISAIKSETSVLMEQLESVESIASPYQIYKGTLKGIDVILCICGLGKGNAAAATQTMIDRFEVQEIINLGICGGLRPDAKIGDVIVSASFVQHDFNLGLGDRHYAWHPTYESHLVTTQLPRSLPLNADAVLASGDMFINDLVVKQRLIELTGASGCDMESAAIAQICFRNRIPFVSIRGVSDIAEDVPGDFDSNMKQAIQSSTELLLRSIIRSPEASVV